MVPLVYRPATYPRSSTVGCPATESVPVSRAPDTAILTTTRPFFPCVT